MIQDAFDALEKTVPEHMKPSKGRGVYWYRVAILLFVIGAAAGFPLSIYSLQSWMKENFVTGTVNSQAWSKQVDINEKLTGQLGDLSKTDGARSVNDMNQDRRLGTVEEDIRELRRILTQPTYKR